MKLDWARPVGWAIPLLCIAIAGSVTVHARGRLMAANKELSDAQLAERTASLAKDNAEKQSGTMRIAAVAPDNAEEASFLEGLRGYAAKNHVQMARWASHLAEPLAPQAPAQGGGDAAPIDPAVKTILRIQGDITLNGPYQGVRNFLHKISRSNRLYTLTNIHWVRKDPGVEVTATVARYVDPTLIAATETPRNQGRS